MNETKPLSRSALVISKTMYAAMRLLSENQRQLPYNELRMKIQQTVVFDAWESECPSDSTRMPRWELNMSCYAIEYVTAGFIVKDSGVWYLTDEGSKQLAQSPEAVFAAAHTAYRIKKRENGKHESIDEDVKEVTEETVKMEYEDAEAKAMASLRDYVRTMDWQDFQRLVAALLRGMGYYVPFIAPQGADGGIDVLAYENASGAGHRIVIQAKRYKDSSVGVEVVRNVAALLYKPTDVGMVVTSGHFTQEAVRFAQSCKNNLRLVDLAELLRLWISHYDRLTPPDRSLMPLHCVYFLEQ